MLTYRRIKAYRSNIFSVDSNLYITLNCLQNLVVSFIGYRYLSPNSKMCNVSLVGRVLKFVISKILS